jgi:hypothetical protein
MVLCSSTNCHQAGPAQAVPFISRLKKKNCYFGQNHAYEQIHLEQHCLDRWSRSVCCVAWYRANRPACMLSYPHHTNAFLHLLYLVLTQEKPWSLHRTCFGEQPADRHKTHDNPKQSEVNSSPMIYIVSTAFMKVLFTTAWGGAHTINLINYSEVMCKCTGHYITFNTLYGS